MVLFNAEPFEFKFDKSFVRDGTYIFNIKLNNISLRKTFTYGTNMGLKWIICNIFSRQNISIYNGINITKTEFMEYIIGIHQR